MANHTEHMAKDVKEQILTKIEVSVNNQVLIVLFPEKQSGTEEWIRNPFAVSKWTGTPAELKESLTDVATDETLKQQSSDLNISAIVSTE